MEMDLLGNIQRAYQAVPNFYQQSQVEQQNRNILAQQVEDYRVREAARQQEAQRQQALVNAFSQAQQAPAQPNRNQVMQPQPYQQMPISNYGQVQAMEQMANLYKQQYSPIMDWAFQKGDNEIWQSTADKLISSGNPLLVGQGQQMKQMTLEASGEWSGAPINLAEPAVKQSFFNRNKAYLESQGYTDPSQLPDGVYSIKYKGSRPGAPDVRISEMKRESAAAQQHRETSKDWWTTDKKPVTFDKNTGRYYDLSGELLSEADLMRIPKEEKGTVGSLRGKWASTGVPGVSRNRDSNMYAIREQQPDGSFKDTEISSEQLAEIDRNSRAGRAAAAQSGAAKTAALFRANELFKEMAPKLKEWKKQLKEEDKDRLLSLVTSSKTINELTNKIESMFSDNPTQALLLKNTVLLADALSTVYGAGPGGQWSFETAKAMLDPMVGISSFDATLDSHGHKIESSLKAAKDFPKSFANPIPKKTPKAMLPGKKDQKITKNIVREYFKLYGNRAAAEEAARKDGWSF